MAKFFITNKKEWYDSCKEQLSKAHHAISFDYADGALYCIAVQKKVVRNENGYSSNDGFCVATGTCVFNGSLDYKSMFDAYTGDVLSLREQTLGQYGVGIYKNKALYVYGDPMGAYDVYYFSSEDGYIISSSLYDMALVLGHKLTLDEFNILERTVCRAILNGETFFKEIHRLRGDEMVYVKDATSAIEVKQLPVELPCAKDDDYEQTVKLAAQTLQENAKKITKALGVPTVCVTGGLDSRLVLATLLSIGIKPRLLYGVGNNVSNPLSFSQQQDLKMAKLYADTFGLELSVDDWSIPEQPDRDWNELISEYGFPAAYVWGGSKNIVQSMLQTNQCVNFGWGGEYLRYYVFGKQYNSLEDFVTDAYLGHCMAKDLAYKVDPNFEKKVLSKFQLEAKRLQLNSGNTSNDEMFSIETVFRGQQDTQIPSFLQQLNYTYLYAFEYNFLRHRVSWAKKDKARFQLDIINALYPAILDIPIFSANRMQKLNRETMEMEDAAQQVEKMYQSGLSAFVRSISSDWLKRKILRPIKRAIYAKYTGSGNTTPAYSSPTDTLKCEKYTISSSEFSYSEDAAIWSILHRALKLLGY